jgi:hypothetical protein
MGARGCAVVVSLGLSACLGTTGNAIVHFRAAVAGPENAVSGAPLEFTSAGGWHVVLTKAVLHVGAIYLEQTLFTSGGGPGPCVLPGTYVGEVTTDAGGVAGIDADLLSPAPHYFPNDGQGTNLEAKTAQVFLAGAEVDQIEDSTPILQVAGTADRNGQSIAFVGTITIGGNFATPSSDSTKPGANPTCRERVVSPIPVDIVPRDGGTLLLRVDPTHPLFDAVDFSALCHPPTATACAFGDSMDDAEGKLLYVALTSTGALYRFVWEDSAP